MIETGEAVAVHYALWIDDDDPLETTFGAEPECFRFARGEFPPYLEQRVATLEEGQSTEFLIPASAAVFGFYDPDKRHAVAIDSFGEVECLPGMLVEFELPNGDQASGRIEALVDDDAIVDFNHPLAGRDVHCRLQRVAVPASEDP